MMEHFTAWVTTDSSMLAGEYCDVVVLRDEEKPQEREDGTMGTLWVSQGDPLFHIPTTVKAAGDDTEEAFKQAAELLAEAGWTVEGSWTPVTSGGIATVSR